MKAQVFSNGSKLSIIVDTGRPGGNCQIYFVPDAPIAAGPLTIGSATAWDASHGWYLGPAISRWVRTPSGHWGIRIELQGGVDMGMSGKQILGSSFPNSNPKLIEITIDLLG